MRDYSSGCGRGWFRRLPMSKRGVFCVPFQEGVTGNPERRSQKAAAKHREPQKRHKQGICIVQQLSSYAQAFQFPSNCLFFFSQIFQQLPHPPPFSYFSLLFCTLTLPHLSICVLSLQSFIPSSPPLQK